MTPPLIKGWCPGAYKPMQSGDGLIVRIRPRLGHLEPDQTRGLCDLASRFGNGTLDLTSRANLQIRGVAAEKHGALLQALMALDLLDPDPATEGRRNIVVDPFWEQDDLTETIGNTLIEALPSLPCLPGKMGFAIDTGRHAILHNASADFRFELCGGGCLILRADGCAQGRKTSLDRALQDLIEMVEWFVETGGLQSGRMARHLDTHALPDTWQEATPRKGEAPRVSVSDAQGPILGAAFGQLGADDLQRAMAASGAQALRVMPGRLFQLRGGSLFDAAPFVSEAHDPLLSVHACPGAPACTQSSVETRALARKLSKSMHPGTDFHVSGCAKGCAYPRAAPVTLVGRDGSFDLVRDGRPWDEPQRAGLSPYSLDDLMNDGF